MTIATTGSVDVVRTSPSTAAQTSTVDAESQEWVRALRAADGGANAELHALLLRAARFEVARRKATLPHLRGNELDDIAMEAADDAMMSVLRRLDDFRGESRFTTWAYKFALLEAAVKLRRRAWQGREVPLEAEVEAVRHAIAEVLSAHQRRVLIALAVNGVPIDVLAERLNTNRGALYKTLHDARRKLRSHLEERGLAPGDRMEDR
jgi:RNA polymerase sigma-70 factor (ECF subfamily)